MRSLEFLLPDRGYGKLAIGKTPYEVTFGMETEGAMHIAGLHRESRWESVCSTETDFKLSEATTCEGNDGRRHRKRLMRLRRVKEMNRAPASNGEQCWHRQVFAMLSHEGPCEHRALCHIPAATYSLGL